MRFSSRIALAALFVAFTAAGDVRAGWNERTQAEAEAYIARFMRPSGKPQIASALSVAIGIDGAMMWGRGLGEEAPGRPATVNTVYRIGSITKQFTAGAILRLQELAAMGGTGPSVLRLARPVSDYIEGVDGWTAKGQLPVTIRSLLISGS